MDSGNCFSANGDGRSPAELMTAASCDVFLSIPASCNNDYVFMHKDHIIPRRM